jgi:hypothetical protein
LAPNAASHRPLYAAARRDAEETAEDAAEGAAADGAAWVAAAGARLGTNWTWCVEETARFEDYAVGASSTLPPALAADATVHVA